MAEDSAPAIAYYLAFASSSWLVVRDFSRDSGEKLPQEHLQTCRFADRRDLYETLLGPSSLLPRPLRDARNPTNVAGRKDLLRLRPTAP